MISRAVAARGGLTAFVPIAAVFAVAIVISLQGLFQRASPAASVQPTQDGQAARSSPLSLGVTDVHPSAATDGSVVLGVHLTARVHVTQAITLATAAGVRYPRFRLIPPGSVGVEGTYSAPPGPSPTLAAGSTTTYDLAFDFRGLSVLPPAGREVAIAGNVPPAPGTWLLEMQLVDQAGLSYDLTTPVTIVAAA